MFVLFVFFQVSCSSNVTDEAHLSQRLWTQVPEYGALATINYQLLPHETVTHMINFTARSSLDFIHFVGMVSCTEHDVYWNSEIRLSRNRGRTMEDFNKNVYESKDLTPTAASTRWIADFNLEDCLDTGICIFGITISTQNPCIGSIELERGETVPHGHQLSFIVPANATNRPKRLVRYYPRDVPQELHITGSGRWFIFYAWGYSQDAHMVGSVGTFEVSLDKKGSRYTLGDRLMIWFDASPGKYTFEFLERESLLSVEMSIGLQVLVVALGFIFTFITVFTTMYVYLVRTRCRSLVPNRYRQPRVIHSNSLETQHEVSMPPRATAWEIQSNTKTTSFKEVEKRKMQLRKEMSRSPVKMRLQDCVICMESFAGDIPVRVLACGHCFHVDCIDPWLMSIKKECPICHQAVDQAQNFFRSVSNASKLSERNKNTKPCFTTMFSSEHFHRNGSDASFSRSRIMSCEADKTLKFTFKSQKEDCIQPFKMILSNHQDGSPRAQSEVVIHMKRNKQETPNRQQFRILPMAKGDLMKRKRTPELPTNMNQKHSNSSISISLTPQTDTNTTPSGTQDLGQQKLPPWKIQIIRDNFADDTPSVASFTSENDPRLPSKLNAPMLSMQGTSTPISQNILRQPWIVQDDVVVAHSEVTSSGFSFLNFAGPSSSLSFMSQSPSVLNFELFE